MVVFDLTNRQIVMEDKEGHKWFMLAYGLYKRVDTTDVILTRQPTYDEQEKGIDEDDKPFLHFINKEGYPNEDLVIIYETNMKEVTEIVLEMITVEGNVDYRDAFIEGLIKKLKQMNMAFKMRELMR